MQLIPAVAKVNEESKERRSLIPLWLLPIIVFFQDTNKQREKVNKVKYIGKML